MAIGSTKALLELHVKKETLFCGGGICSIGQYMGSYVSCTTLVKVCYYRPAFPPALVT